MILQPKDEYVYELFDGLLEGGKGRIVVLKVYMDESGTHDGSPVVNVGAYMATKEDWAIFTKRWNKKKGDIKAYHSVDLHNQSGEFKDWDQPKRVEFVIGMLPILEKAKVAGFVAGINLIAFKEHMDKHPELHEVFPSPYSACVQWTVSRCCHIADLVGERDIAFVHEINDYQKEALEAFAFVQTHLSEVGFNLSMTFADKKLAPLQAADIIAYEGNWMLRDPKAPVRKPWKAIDPHEAKAEVFHYGPENMAELVNTLLTVKAMPPDELREAARKSALSGY